MTDDLLVYTQDVDMERDWILSQFPGYKSLETFSSNRWPCSVPDNFNRRDLYEIAYRDYFSHEQLININMPSMKSVFSNSLSMDDKNWIYADNIISNITFLPVTQVGNDYQVITFARTGTVFLESILNQRYFQLGEHLTLGTRAENYKTKDFLRSNPTANTVVVYRKDWWNWLTSLFISETYGFSHHNDSINWSNLTPVELSQSYIESKQKQIINMWNFLCNLRVQLPENPFYLVEFSEFVNRYSNLTDHKKINYDKRNLISNFDLVEDLFRTQYEPVWKLFEINARRHLHFMKCFSNLDLLLN